MTQYSFAKKKKKKNAFCSRLKGRQNNLNDRYCPIAVHLQIFIRPRQYRKNSLLIKVPI